MNNINTVCIAGNIVADAKSDKVTTFAVAVSTSMKDGEEYTDYANFIDCVMFGKFGKTMSQYLTKGTKVMVHGKLHQSRWESKDGDKRSRLEVWVDAIELAPRASAKKSRGNDDEYIPF